MTVPPPWYIRDDAHLTAMDTMTQDLPELAPIYAEVPAMRGELRSDHAGESGAVMIYRGILAACADPTLRAFAAEHLATEAEHVRLLEAMGAPRSILLPIWRVAGFLTGYLPGLAGRRAVYATIEAVETFVDHHYAAQIAMLGDAGEQGTLKRILLQCQGDEVHHRDEAAAALGTGRGMLLRLWGAVVAGGSKAAVSAARVV
jgi:ubiquinone biosynthesis monooxygenase Coq7